MLLMSHMTQKSGKQAQSKFHLSNHTNTYTRYLNCSKQIDWYSIWIKNIKIFYVMMCHTFKWKRNLKRRVWNENKNKLLMNRWRKKKCLEKLENTVGYGESNWSYNNWLTKNKFFYSHLFLQHHMLSWGNHHLHVHTHPTIILLAVKYEMITSLLHPFLRPTTGTEIVLNFNLFDLNEHFYLNKYHVSKIYVANNLLIFKS